MAQNNTPTRNPATDIEMLFAAGMGSPVTPLGFTAPLGLLPLLASATPAYAANLTFDPSQAVLWQPAALTGAVQVNAPARADGTAIKIGTLLIPVWLQDGVGGRVVTYVATAGGFKLGGAAAATTAASTLMLDIFYFDGTWWRILSRITGQAA